MKNKLFNIRFFIAIVIIAAININKINAQFASGSGTVTDPYLITTADQLNSVRDNLTKYFKLGNDIDLTNWLNSNSATNGWNPIGTSVDAGGVAFSGGLDGNGHFITGLWINRPTEKGVALFGWVQAGCIIKKLGVIIPDGKSITGLDNVAGLIGATNYSSVKIYFNECLVQGNITALGQCAGGLIGYTSNNGGVEITDCYTTGTITATSKAGGLIGQAYRRAKVTSSYSTSTVACSAGNAGGLIGELGFPNGSSVRYDIAYSAALNSSVSGKISDDIDGDGVFTSYTGRLVGYQKPNAGNGEGIYIFENNYAYDGMTVNGAQIADGTIENKNALNQTKVAVTSAGIYTDADKLYWYMDDIWVFGNGNYRLPVLKNISLTSQPTALPAHLTSTGILDKYENGLEVYPSFTSGIVYIKEKSENVQSEVYNSLGKLILTSKDSKLDLSAYSNGIYMIKVQNKIAKVVKR